MVGGNVGGSREDNGNLTDLKKHGLLSTFEFVSFTDKGRATAEFYGVTIAS